ncbi:SURF1-like protein [Sulfurimicrobium lacus]|uniref:SURF1-like protein n=1 Tax=Sulfurimicrobium lacus TaxID=2715678 RepID=A0A6F8VEW9_9PROT|nr:SURF1 family protein [Sulfurimicrobium lacus]BCB27492.1 SURF1-like protein [Sulfurimicrobium lacus]
MMASYRFRPKLLQTLATLMLLPLLGQLGLWQWHKADAKRALQHRVDAVAHAPLKRIGPAQVSADSLRGHRVLLRGHFEADRQILLDNQIHGEQAGYRVLTPLRIAGGDVRVLVDRGWVPLGRSRDAPPTAEPPGNIVEVSGTLWEPARPRFFAPTPASAADKVWESVDLARFAAQVPYPLERFVVRLDAGAPGCYACDLPRPDEKVAMHLGYAVQWFGMAGVLLVFYLYAGIQREGSDGNGT